MRNVLLQKYLTAETGQVCNTITRNSSCPFRSDYAGPRLVFWQQYHQLFKRFNLEYRNSSQNTVAVCTLSGGTGYG